MTFTMKMLPYKQANAKITIYAADIYLFKVNNKSLKQGVYTALSYQKRHQDDLIDIRTLRNIDITLMSLLLTLKRFHSFAQYFIVAFGESCWLGLPAGIKVQKVKVMKQAKTGANYVILTKWIKLQEINPASYLKSMQNVGFEQTSTKFIEIFVA